MRRCLLTLVVLVGLAGTVRADTNYYVATTGSDSNPCSLAQPCLTVAHAQTVVRAAVTAGLTAPVNVYLRGGTYTRATGLAFGAADSGTSSYPITWQAYPGEVPVISGGQEITGWSAATGVQNYYFTITPTTNSNADLYYDLSLAPAGFWTHVRSDGGDIRVMKQDGVTQVAREVSAFNSTAHTGALYISTASGTATSYYVYYGMPSATEPAANATYGKYNAWASSAEAVWHFEDVTDSTVHQHSGVPPTVADPVTAKLLKGQNFSLSTPSDYVITDDMTALHGATAMTAMAWIKQTTVTTNMVIVSKWDYSTPHEPTDQGTFALQTGAFSANELTAYIATSPTDDGSGCRVDTTGAGLTNGQWAHVAWVFDGSLTGNANRLKVYVNGSPVTVSQGSGNVPAALTSATVQVRIGLFGGSLHRFFAGTIDDARIYTRAFTATEIATMYTNQNAPGTFWTTGAETATTVQGLFRATVGTDWDFRQLYVNGVHAERAHGNAFPSGWTITAGGFTAPDSSMALWGNLTDAEICAHGSWSMACCKVASVDGPSITMQTPCHTNVWTLPAGWNFVPWFVGNAYELLAAGYWYLNRTTGVLYYMPSGGTMSGLTIVAPVATQLLTITGAHDIAFDKLSFSYSNWTDPDSGTGYVGWQAGNYWTGAGTLNYLTDPRMQTGAIAIAGSQHISLTNSQVAHMGSRAVTVLGGSQNIVLANNTFTDNASGAIQAGTSLLADCPGTQESAVTITGNLINSGNTFDYVDSGGIVAPCVTASTISNNEIHGTYSMPITIGWGWGYQGAAHSTNNTVASNSIDTFCVFTDCGGIYSNGSQSATGAYLTGLKVTGNFLRHGTMSIGALYGDNASAWATWTGNVTQNTSSGYWAFAAGDAHDMTFTGNYNDNAVTLNLGTNVTITSNTTITSGTQPFGTPAQAVICAAGIPGATACATPKLWPQWQTGVGATWSRPQLGP